MAIKTISNAGGLWSATTTWVGGIIPTAADDVVATATSGPVTIGAAAVCGSIDLSLYTSTLTHNAFSLTVGSATAGALNFSGAWTYTPAVSTACSIILTSWSATYWDVQFGVGVQQKHPYYISFNNSSGHWTLVDDVAMYDTTGTYFTLANGALNATGRTISTGIFQTSGTSTVNLTNAVLNVGYSSSVTNALQLGSASVVTTTGLTINYIGTGSATTYSTLLYLNTAVIPTLNILNVQNKLSLSGTAINITNLNLGATGPAATLIMGFSSNIGTLTCTGSNQNKVFIRSGVYGTPVTMTVGDTTGVTYANFQDITAAGAATWNFIDGSDVDPTRGTVGDCLGNDGGIAIAFPPLRELKIFQVSGTVLNYWHWNHTGINPDVYWRLADGTTPARVALPHDNVTVAAIANPRRLIIDIPNACANLTCVGIPSGNFYPSEARAVNYYGNINIDNVGGLSRGGYGMVLCGRGDHTLSIKNFLTDSTAAGITINSVGGSYTLAADLTLANPSSSNFLSVTLGKFVTDGFTYTASSFQSIGTLTRTIDISNSTLNLVSGGGGAAPINLTNTGLTFICGKSTIKFGYSGAVSHAVNSAGMVFDTINFTGTHTGTVTLNSMTVNNLLSNGTPRILTIPVSNTVTVLKNFKLQGNSTGKAQIIGAGNLVIACPTPQSVSNMNLTRVRSIGPALYADKSINSGSNINVNFYPADTWSTAKTLEAWGFNIPDPNQIISAGLLVASYQSPGASLSIGSTLTPAALSGIYAVLAATTLQNSNFSITAGVQSIVATALHPDLVTDYRITVGSVSAAFSVWSTTTSQGASISPATQSAVWDALSRTVVTDSVLTPATITALFSALHPFIDVTGAIGLISVLFQSATVDRVFSDYTQEKTFIEPSTVKVFTEVN